MRWWWVRCYGGPLDLERVKVADPRPPSLMVPEPPRTVKVAWWNTSELPESTDPPKFGEYKLGWRRVNNIYPQMFEQSREISYLWEGWR